MRVEVPVRERVRPLVGSITSRCSGKATALLPEVSTRGGTWTSHERAMEIEPRLPADSVFFLHGRISSFSPILGFLTCVWLC